MESVDGQTIRIIEAPTIEGQERTVEVASDRLVAIADIVEITRS